MTRAVVLAAGLGKRLRPLTERWPKPVLPIDGVPVLQLVLRELEDAGCTDVTVVVGHLAEQVRRLVGNRVRYAIQEEQLGSGHAAAVAEAEPPYLVVGADTAFTPGDVGRFVRTFAASGAAGAVALTPRAPDGPPRNGVLVAGDRVVRLLDAGGTHDGAPLWAVGRLVGERVAQLHGSPPHELAAAFQASIDAGDAIAGIEIGPTRDLTTPADLVLENFPYLSGT